MEQTFPQQLPFPTDNDPADGALDLQILAEAIDAKLVDQFAAYRDVINVPAYLIRLSANQTGIGSGADTTVAFDQVVFGSASSVIIPFEETGYYRVGAYLSCVASGTVNTGTLRQVTMTFRQQRPIPFGTVVFENVASETFESNTGGEHMVVENLVRVEDVSPPGSFVELFLFHLNTGSTLTINAGAVMWAYKVSDLEVV